jgi:hypothetical protein
VPGLLHVGSFSVDALWPISCLQLLLLLLTISSTKIFASVTFELSLDCAEHKQSSASG